MERPREAKGIGSLPQSGGQLFRSWEDSVWLNSSGVQALGRSPVGLEDRR